jgi:hypothetical protein
MITLAWGEVRWWRGRSAAGKPGRGLHHRARLVQLLCLAFVPRALRSLACQGQLLEPICRVKHRCISEPTQPRRWVESPRACHLLRLSLNHCRFSACRGNSSHAALWSTRDVANQSTRNVHPICKNHGLHSGVHCSNEVCNSSDDIAFHASWTALRSRS